MNTMAVLLLSLIRLTYLRRTHVFPVCISVFFTFVPVILTKISTSINIKN